MQKSSHSQPVTSSSETIPYTENRFHEWIADYGRKVIYLILGLIILFLLMYRLSSGSKANALTDYLNADNDFLRFQESSLTESLSPTGPLTHLEEILNRRPELHARFDGLIAQVLLTKDDPQNAKIFADSAFQRIQRDHLPYYTDYAQTTLLISENKYQEALESAQDLKKKMLATINASDDQQQFGEMLFLFNLIRIAFLEQQMGIPSQELATWQEVSTRIQPQENQKKSSKRMQKSLQAFNAHFQQGNASLLNYIKEREKKLAIE